MIQKSTRRKNKGLLSIEKILQNEQKCLIIIIKTIILKNHYLKKTFGEEYKDVLKTQF